MPPHLTKSHKSAYNVRRRQLYHANRIVFRFGCTKVRRQLGKNLVF